MARAGRLVREGTTHHAMDAGCVACLNGCFRSDRPDGRKIIRGRVSPIERRLLVSLIPSHPVPKAQTQALFLGWFTLSLSLTLVVVIAQQERDPDNPNPGANTRTYRLDCVRLHLVSKRREGANKNPLHTPLNQHFLFFPLSPLPLSLPSVIHRAFKNTPPLLFGAPDPNPQIPPLLCSLSLILSSLSSSTRVRSLSHPATNSTHGRRRQRTHRRLCTTRRLRSGQRQPARHRQEQDP